jgi:hypothetical protein
MSVDVGYGLLKAFGQPMRLLQDRGYGYGHDSAVDDHPPCICVCSFG